ncbi:MAG TPA: hypothetical protein VMW34_11305 [Anaerolineales bacterium]|nr:hypothetical protein [Anaerolineales bacterium]
MFDASFFMTFINELNPVSWVSILKPYFLLYLGPDTLLPAASICGAAIGFVLIFGRYILGMAKNVYRKLTMQADLSDPGSPTETEPDIEKMEL